MGVRIPVIKKYAKELLKQDWKEYLKTAEDNYYEEVMLQGIVIGFAEMDIEDKLVYVERFVPKIDNWAVCDTFCASLKIVRKAPKRVWDFLQQYFQSDKEFELRFAVVMLLDYYINSEYIKLVLNILNNIKHDGYYVKMAVAWAIAEAYIKYPEDTMELLKKNNLDKFTYNKAIQKCIESYRVTETQKDILKKMKR